MPRLRLRRSSPETPDRGGGLAPPSQGLSPFSPSPIRGGAGGRGDPSLPAFEGYT